MVVQIDPEGVEIKYLRRLVDFDGKRVLEIGCGDGRLTWRYANRASRVTGIDLHPEDLRVATIDRPSDLEQVVAFALADALHLPFEQGAFDLAIFAWSF